MLIIRVNGHITLSSKLKSTLNERKLKQNTHLKQDLCSGFTRIGFTEGEQEKKRRNFCINTGLTCHTCKRREELDSDDSDSE